MSEPKQGSGILNVLQRLNKYEFAVELWIMRDGRNKNKWDYRNLQEHYLTFRGAPILCAYVGREIGDGHNMREVKDYKTGESYYTFTDGTAERIVGTISDDESDLSLQERDGHTWIVAKGRLWSFYAPELVDKIVRTGRMEVSAETEVVPGREEYGYEVYTDWTGIGVTVLGDNVPPAIPGARIAALAAMQDEFKEMKLRAASLSSETNKPKTSRKGVKKMNNKQAIDRLAPKFEGYKIVGLSDDCMRVALVNATGCAFSYTFNAEDGEEIIESRIRPASLSTVYAFDGEDMDIAVDMGDIVDYVATNCKTYNVVVADLQAQLDTANNTIKTMQDAEHKRRIEAVKTAVNAAADAIRNAAADDDADPSEDAKAIADNAEQYASMEDKGEFVGDKKAAHDLMAACMEKRLEKAQNSQRKSFAWSFDNGEHGDTGGIDGMFSYFSNK